MDWYDILMRNILKVSRYHQMGWELRPLHSYPIDIKIFVIVLMLVISMLYLYYIGSHSSSHVIQYLTRRIVSATTIIGLRSMCAKARTWISSRLSYIASAVLETSLESLPWKYWNEYLDPIFRGNLCQHNCANLWLYGLYPLPGDSHSQIPLHKHLHRQKHWMTLLQHLAATFFFHYLLRLLMRNLWLHYYSWKWKN